MKHLALALTAAVTLSAAAADDTPLRIAVAGVTHGHLGEVAQRIHRGDFVVVGVWEENDAYRADNDLTPFLTPETFYADLETMLDAVRPEAVVAYGPIADHRRVVEACAPRGIHVMVEKPLATTAEDARAMAALAQKHGIELMTNYETTWYRANHKAAEMVRAGEIGPLYRINVYDGHQGPVEIGCSPRFLEWLLDPVKNGGGAVIDFGCYGANLATMLMQGRRPKSVYAVLHRNKPETYREVDDDATIVLDYGDCTAQIMGSWCWPFARKDMHLWGRDAELYQKDGNTLLKNGESVDTQALAADTPPLDSFLYLKGLVRDTLTEQPHDLSALPNNVTVVEILDAARRSTASGQPVTL